MDALIDSPLEQDDETEENLEERRAEMLDSFGLALAETRTEAVRHRQSIGVETEWVEDREFYEADYEPYTDETNTQKPLYRAVRGASKPTGSQIGYNITRPYCDGAGARVGDMLMPSNKNSWSIHPTPVPDMVEVASGKIPPRLDQKISDAFPDNPAVAQKTRDEATETFKQLLADANHKAKRAETRILDWHIEGAWHDECRVVIDDAAKWGTGILKGPRPELHKVIAFIGEQLVLKEDIIPVSRRVDRWNVFPDPLCGNSIHDGAYIWERDDISRRRLETLRDDKSYLEDQIEKVLEEGPHEASNVWDTSVQEKGGKPGLTPRNNKHLFEIWYYFGLAMKDQLEACGIECDEEAETYSVELEMINNRVIRAKLNLLDTGEFPYDFMVWQKREGTPWGLGVARQIRAAQRVVNGALRAMMDNAGVGARPMLVYDPNKIEPATGNAEIKGGKIWQVAEGAETDDVRKAFWFVEAPMLQKECEAIIQLGLKMAEDVTGLPMLMQGQQGTAPETVGGMQILQNNAGTVLRRLARIFDSSVTEPHVRRYYAYLMQYGEDEEKGDFKVEARGSSTLVERDLQNQQIFQMGGMTQNPIYGLDPKKWSEQFLRSNRLEPSDFTFTDEKWAELVQNWGQILEAQKQMGSPQAEAAKIRAQAVIALENARQEFEGQQRDKDRALEMALGGLDLKLKEAEQIMAQITGNNEAKTRLAEVAMKLRTQIQLSRETMQNQKEMASEPPTEPAGKAGNGKAYQQ